MAIKQLRNITEGTGLVLADHLKRWALRSPATFARLARSSPRFTESLSAAAAVRSARHAIASVPAYRDLLAQNGWSDNHNLGAHDWLAKLPVTDKAGYIKSFNTAERCVGGHIPLRGTEMDESSGSSGTPYNWVRSSTELAEVHRTLSCVAAVLFGDEVVTINCFSMGAWSTGINTAAALRNNGLIKSPGPDVVKVIDTLQFLGSQYTYVITGYPPFLRELLEQGEIAGIKWSEYKMFGVVGGEGMSEQLRTRLERNFVKIYSAYGASDLDIGVATETPASIRLRQAAAANPALRRELFGDHSRLPMFFQYNPLDYFIETNQENELIITVNRMSMLSPRIRYNIHDSGGALSYGQVCEIAARHDVEMEVPGEAIFHLPFLFVAGRSDSTLSYMGANIYPEDVEQGLLDQPELADQVHAFCMELVEIEAGVERPRIHVELTHGIGDSGLQNQFVVSVRDRLMQNSRDYRAAVAESPAAAEIQVQLHELGSGPFVDNATRLKRRYILSSTTTQETN